MLIHVYVQQQFKVEDWRYEIKFKRRRRDIRSTSIKKRKGKKRDKCILTRFKNLSRLVVT